MTVFIQVLKKNPGERLSLNGILTHPWIRSHVPSCKNPDQRITGTGEGNRLKQQQTVVPSTSAATSQISNNSVTPKSKDGPFVIPAPPVPTSSVKSTTNSKRPYDN